MLHQGKRLLLACSCAGTHASTGDCQPARGLPLTVCCSSLQALACDEEEPCGALVLHVQPRPQAAGLEAAVYSGTAMELGGTGSIRVSFGFQSELHALPSAPADVAAFAASTIAASPEEWAPPSEFINLQLPLQPPRLNDARSSWGWRRAMVELHPAGAVHVQHKSGGVSWMTTAATFPDVEYCGFYMCAAVDNGSWRYMQQQHALMERQAELQAVAAAGEAPPEPSPAFREAFRDVEDWDGAAYRALAFAPVRDPREVFERRWRELRDRPAADLAAALTAMLQRAVSYRGDMPYPRQAPAPPAAAAGAAQAAGAAAAAAEEEMGDA